MGILDRLMFWRDDKADGGIDGFEVEGCFTLPATPTVDTDPTSVAEGGYASALGPIGDRVEAGGTVDGEDDLLAEALGDPIDQIADQPADQSEEPSRTLRGDGAPNPVSDG
ncbi:MAG: hypothetical protein OER95_09710 [Acidimicrobiia bacterium]|nr:hypothetical protein [Acidimicrobiia bacterium]